MVDIDSHIYKWDKVGLLCKKRHVDLIKYDRFIYDIDSI
jgi:hypothetical protein